MYVALRADRYDDREMEAENTPAVAALVARGFVVLMVGLSIPEWSCVAEAEVVKEGYALVCQNEIAFEDAVQLVVCSFHGH